VLLQFEHVVFDCGPFSGLPPCFYGWAHIARLSAAFKEAGFLPVGHFVFPKRRRLGSRFVRYQHEAAYLLACGEPSSAERLYGADVKPRGI